MKKIEKLIEKAKGNKIALIVPEELIDTVEKYFYDDGLYDFIKEVAKNYSFGIDFDNDEKVLDYGVYDFYVDQEYELITLTKEDFEEVKSLTFDNRTLLVTYNNSLYVNNKTNDIYFSDEEVEQLFKTISNPFSYIVIPAFGKKFERKPHISIY